jgi:two-component system KDP operon response regulator KdpE
MTSDTSDDLRAGTSGHDEPRSFLVIEDERKIRDIVHDAVSTPSDRWFYARTGAEGLTIAAEGQIDLVILDLGLPDMDGLDVCRRLRELSTVPIVVLSARQSERDKVALLDAGADDYVTKPFLPGELQARVRAQLRRARTPIGAADQLLFLGNVAVDLQRRTVAQGNIVVHLTPTEWSLLAALARQPGRTLTHDQLFAAVWGKEFGHPQQYLRVYITHLRKKIEPQPYAPRFIVTEPGVGYRLELDSQNL